jgi:ABC-2 type transport system permease protein
MTVRVETAQQVREGSPWTGLWAVVTKDMADHLTSIRMQILEFLIVLTAIGSVYAGIQNLMKTVSQDQFLFLRLFTTASEPLWPFVELLGILVPLIAISLGFDAINGEFNRRTLSRILAQPIYRDALLLGKFLAGLFTLALVLAAIWLLIIGMGIVRLGVPPNGEEVARLLIYLLATIFYGGIWLALALVFSVLFRQPATAALAALAVWLFFLIFWGTLSGLIARTFIFQPIEYGVTQQQALDAILAQDRLAQALGRFSPNTLYAEVTVAVLRPEVRAFGLMAMVLQQLTPGAIIGTPLPLPQSLLLVWPQLTGLIAATILLFALGYVLFQREEIRA